jgi:hypothetical protein
LHIPNYIGILEVCPKRLPLQELTNELQNRGIDYGNRNKRQKLVEILDKELTKETLENEGNYCTCVCDIFSL